MESAGIGIWDSSGALDTAFDISYEAGMNLLDPEDFEFDGKGWDYTAKAMNEGLFETLLERYMGGKYCRAYEIVILTMMAMGLGVDLSRRTRAYVWSIATDAGLFAEGVRQIRAALIDYEDGRIYDKDTLQLAELAEQLSGIVTLEDSEECGETQFYEPDRVNLGYPECGFCGWIVLFGRSGRTLKQCAGCRKILYCGRSCQKGHWKFHKAACTSRTEDSARNEGANDEGLNAEQQVAIQPEVNTDHPAWTI